MEQLIPFRMGAMENQRAQPYDFEIGTVIEQAWKRVGGVKASMWGGVLCVFLVSLLFVILQTIASQVIDQKSVADGVSFILNLLSVFFVLPLSVGLSYLGVRRAVDLPVATKQIFSAYNFKWRLFGLYLLQILIISIFTISFVILMMIYQTQSFNPIVSLILIMGIVLLGFLIVYVSMSLMFSYLLIIEKQLTIGTALLASFHAFNQHWFKIIVTWILMLIIYIFSIIPLLIGWIWTVPMMINLMGVLYRIIFGVEEIRKLKTMKE